MQFGGKTGRGQGYHSSHQLKNLTQGTDSFFLAGIFASFVSFKRNPGSPRLQHWQSQKKDGGLPSPSPF